MNTLENSIVVTVLSILAYNSVEMSENVITQAIEELKKITKLENSVKEYRTNVVSSLIKQTKAIHKTPVMPRDGCYNYFGGKSLWNFSLTVNNSEMKIINNIVDCCVRDRTLRLVDKRKLIPGVTYLVFYCIFFRGILINKDKKNRFVMYDIDRDITVSNVYSIFDLPDELFNVPPQTIHCTLDKDTWCESHKMSLNFIFTNVVRDSYLMVNIKEQITFNPPSYLIDLECFNKVGRMKVNLTNWFKTVVYPKLEIEVFRIENVMKLPEEILDPFSFGKVSPDLSFAICSVIPKEVSPDLSYAIFKIEINASRLLPLQIAETEDYGDFKLDFQVNLFRGAEINIKPTLILEGCTFFAQVADSSTGQFMVDKLEKMINRIEETCSFEEITGIPFEDEFVLTLASDNLWHRAQVIKTKGSVVTIELCDYGMVKDVSVNVLRKMKDKYLLIPAQAVFCSLNRIQSKGTKRERKILARILLGKTLKAVISERTSESTFEVDVFTEDGNSISEVMVSKGICTMVKCECSEKVTVEIINP